MKKLLAVLLSVFVLFTLTACGDEEESGAKDTEKSPSAQTSQTDPTGTGGSEETAFAFSAWSSDRSTRCAIEPDADMAEVLAALGEPQSYFEAESCAFEGLDKTYTYAGFVIETRPDGDKDYVNSILLTDDSAATDEGIYIGSSRAEVLAAYGETDESVPTLLSYTRGCTLSFILDGDTVISIEYLPA